jgi:hypothetical protein
MGAHATTAGFRNALPGFFRFLARDGKLLFTAGAKIVEFCQQEGFSKSAA